MGKKWEEFTANDFYNLMKEYREKILKTTDSKKSFVLNTDKFYNDSSNYRELDNITKR